MEHSTIYKQEEINKSSNKIYNSQISLENGRLNEKIKTLREKVERVETMQTAEVNKLFFRLYNIQFFNLS